ncbi:MAG: hypothetical protein RIK87_03280 [Fuerstiella sp.]
MKTPDAAAAAVATLSDSSGRTRLPDDRPPVNELRLQQNGIHLVSGRRLILLTDLPVDQVAELPVLADQLFDWLQNHFGPLPAAVDGSEFQVTGHLIGDESRFRAAGLLPSSALTFKHGRHLNYQFWMYNPEFEYYRRHLLFHEFTHCFMTCESGMTDIPPLWYIEGMAEFAATHRITDSRRKPPEIEFGVLPEQFDGYEGWGRISELQRRFRPATRAQDASPKIPALADVMPDTVGSFGEDSEYATSWAVCWMIYRHPEYRRVFQPLSRLRTRQEFITEAARLRSSVELQLQTDWLLFCETLIEGFDVELSFPEHAQQTWQLSDLSDGPPFSMLLKADADWQDTGLRLTTSQQVRISVEGRYAVNDQPKPWISEPQGVSIEYYRHKPLGQIVAILINEADGFVSGRIEVGPESIITAEQDCSLWLQVNDSSASRRNNSGTAEVRLSAP